MCFYTSNLSYQALISSLSLSHSISNRERERVIDTRGRERESDRYKRERERESDRYKREREIIMTSLFTFSPVRLFQV